jgi:hypothetical protein
MPSEKSMEDQREDRLHKLQRFDGWSGELLMRADLATGRVEAVREEFRKIIEMIAFGGNQKLVWPDRCHGNLSLKLAALSRTSSAIGPVLGLRPRTPSP